MISFKFSVFSRKTECKKARNPRESNPPSLRAMAGQAESNRNCHGKRVRQAKPVFPGGSRCDRQIESATPYVVSCRIEEVDGRLLETA